MAELEIYASATEHDAARRRELERSLMTLGLQPKRRGDTLEVRARGARDEIMRLVDLCEACEFHSVHVTKAEM